MKEGEEWYITVESILYAWSEHSYCVGSRESRLKSTSHLSFRLWFFCLRKLSSWMNPVKRYDDYIKHSKKLLKWRKTPFREDAGDEDVRVEGNKKLRTQVAKKERQQQHKQTQNNVRKEKRKNCQAQTQAKRDSEWRHKRAEKRSKQVTFLLCMNAHFCLCSKKI